ncbi:MAG: helix-turn-helix transcriptional regulator [Pyrobaculum sp.]
MLAVAILVVQLLVITLAAYTGREKIKRLMDNAREEAAVETGDMSEVDRAILRFLEARQGVVYQSEIIKELGLPKSTVHKALRRLAEGGYVEIEKRGKFNVVILKTTLKASVA